MRWARECTLALQTRGWSCAGPRAPFLLSVLYQEAFLLLPPRSITTSSLHHHYRATQTKQTPFEKGLQKPLAIEELHLWPKYTP